MKKQPSIYIMASRRNGTLYTGVTSNLKKRTYQHKKGFKEGFTSKYNCKMLVYFEFFETMNQAISREKQVKLFKRSKKLKLIENINPNWKDLYQTIVL